MALAGARGTRKGKVKGPTRKTDMLGHPNSYQDLSSGPPAEWLFAG